MIEEDSFKFLKMTFDMAERAKLARLNHANEHPYAFVDGEVFNENDAFLDTIIVGDVDNNITQTDIENVFSLYGDVENVFLDERFPGKYYIVKFGDKSAVDEVFNCLDRIVIKTRNMKVFRMRQKPIDRTSNFN